MTIKSSSAVPDGDDGIQGGDESSIRVRSRGASSSGKYTYSMIREDIFVASVIHTRSLHTICVRLFVDGRSSKWQVNSSEAMCKACSELPQARGLTRIMPSDAPSESLGCLIWPLRFSSNKGQTYSNRISIHPNRDHNIVNCLSLPQADQ
jgi:hypothetical protein